MNDSNSNEREMVAIKKYKVEYEIPLFPCNYPLINPLVVKAKNHNQAKQKAKAKVRAALLAQGFNGKQTILAKVVD